MYLETTTPTMDSRPLTISPRHVSTSTAFLTCIASIYKGDALPQCFSFIGKEALKLVKWPTAKPLINLLPSTLIADTGKAFKHKGCNAILRRKFFCHNMVHVPAEPLLPPRHISESSLSGGSAFCLKGAPIVQVPALSSTNLCVREESPIRGNC